MVELIRKFALMRVRALSSRWPGRSSGRILAAVACAALLGGLLALPGCGSGGGSGATLVVNSLDDTAAPPTGTTTLRSAVAVAKPGDTITFNRALDGKTILLSIVGEAHTTLKGEIYAGMTFSGYQDRDYGASALYVRHDLNIDASGLPSGITLKWNGGASSHARVLGVYGNLTMKNVKIAGGYSNADAIAGGTQPYTLARGGGLAVWGVARLDRCTIYGNHCEGDVAPTRDRGTYGGGIYANGLVLTNCVISGNSATGFGAAGGGIYSVGGADNTGGVGNDTSLDRCTVSGNRCTAQHSYGGGIFTLSGGPNNLATMTLTNCTIARNLAEDNPNIAESAMFQYYHRGGGVYMGGGSLTVVSCTIAENEITGPTAMFSGKPNMGGGGVAATIGNAHVVETVIVRHSVIVGNKMNGAASDWFAGSILDFFSQGYNVFGSIDFSQILVPVPEWQNLCRKHYPKAGDTDGATLAQALSVAGARTDSTIRSAGPDAGQPAVLWYPPASLALDKIPMGKYAVVSTLAGYTGFGQSTDDFLNYLLAQVRADYGAVLGADFGSSYGDLTGTTWYGPRLTWPTDPANAAWIAFWQSLDTAIGGKLGTVGLGDTFWSTFPSGALGTNVQLTVSSKADTVILVNTDQRGSARPSGQLGDIGAIEQ